MKLKTDMPVLRYTIPADFENSYDFIVYIDGNIISKSQNNNNFKDWINRIELH
jgi:hypothetical protein